MNEDSSMTIEVDARGTADLVGHTVINSTDLDITLLPINNLIIRAKTQQGKWVEEATRSIGPARARFRSTYFHWAMALNGLHTAAAKYEDPKWQAEHTFTITGLRTTGLGVGGLVKLAEWPGAQAAASHLATCPKMCAWGYIEMYAALEQFVFELYRLYLNHHRDAILRGDEFRELRRLRHQAETDSSMSAAWEDAWRKRLDTWQRKRLYDGLHRVFLAFCTTAGLKAPKQYKHTTVETWAETIEGMGLVRHLLVHGESKVTAELAEFCAKPYSMKLGFKEGEPLSMQLFHLQAFEAFTDQLLNALNISLAEHLDAAK